MGPLPLPAGQLRLPIHGRAAASRGGSCSGRLLVTQPTAQATRQLDCACWPTVLCGGVANWRLVMGTQCGAAAAIVDWGQTNITAITRHYILITLSRL